MADDADCLSSGPRHAFLAVHPKPKVRNSAKQVVMRARLVDRSCTPPFKWPTPGAREAQVGCCGGAHDFG